MNKYIKENLKKLREKKTTYDQMIDYCCDNLLEGDYGIYSYDLGDEVIYEVHGKYNIYNSHNGVVVLKKISD